MSGETQDADIGNEEMDADFASGLAGTVTETPPPKTEAEDTKTDEPTPETTPAPEIVNLTKDQFERLSAAADRLTELETTVRKQFDTAFGGMGALKQMVQKLQTETPAGQPIELSDDDFKELREEYPELADHTVAGLRKIFGRFKGTGTAFDAEAFDKKVNERVSAAVSEARRETLEVMFPDWEQEVRTESFGTWLNGQPDDVKALAASDKVTDAARMLRLYEKAKAAPKAPAATLSPTPAPNRAFARTTAAAVPPRGDGGHPPGPSEDDDFTAGLNYRSRSG
mgnify:CR=1 FL=1